MTPDPLEAEREYLGQLLDAIERCAYFLDAGDVSLSWPLTGAALEKRKKDAQLFGTLAVINERFAKLQDTLGAAMRHAAVLLSEPTDSFLKVLSTYEKAGVIESTAAWQRCRTIRNLAAHDYETSYSAIADHFNALHELQPLLYRSAGLFLSHCHTYLGIQPENRDFSAEFAHIASKQDQT